MTIIRILIMCLWVTVLPAMVGLGIRRKGTKAEQMIFGWILGQVLLWSVFFAVCVPLTLLKRSFSEVYWGYVGICLGLSVFSLIRLLYPFLKRKQKILESGFSEIPKPKNGKTILILWIIVLALFLAQMICVFALAYEEGDDAFYVAITTMSRDADRLYTKVPYTGAFTELSGRYALAPFPVWVAFLAKLADLPGAVTAHLVMPVLVISMAYGIFYLIGRKLLEKEALENSHVMPLYLCFMELLVLFGGYSTYSRENFLLVRAGQGKAVLANIIIPFLLYFLMLLMDRLERKEKTGVMIWMGISAVMVAGCLCSTLGSFLLCMLLGGGGFCAAVAYRRWKILPWLLPCMMVPCIIVLLYLKL